MGVKILKYLVAALLMAFLIYSAFLIYHLAHQRWPTCPQIIIWAFAALILWIVDIRDKPLE